MIISFWNIRGLNSPLKQNKVILRAIQNKIDILCLLETRVKSEKSEAIFNSKFSSWNICTNYDHATNGRIWVMWRKDLNFAIIHVADQSITIKGSYLGFSIFISAIYGSNAGIARRQLWQQLKEVGVLVNHDPWVLGGDFNIFLHAHESSDHDVLVNYITMDMKEFQDFNSEMELLYHPYFGPTFTWSNKQKEFFLARKLNRVLINFGWATAFNIPLWNFLPQEFLTIVWPLPGFLKLLLQIGLNHLSSSTAGLHIMDFWKWHFNKDNFSSISDRVKAKRIELEQQQILSLKGEDSFENEFAIQDELKLLEEAESLFLKQKAKIQWIKNGDKNTKFFHSMVALKNKRDTIRVLMDERGNRLDSFDSMAKEMINFYSNLIGTVDPSVKAIDLSFIKTILNFKLSYEASSSLVKEITGDPLSPYLFVLAINVLSSLLNLAASKGLSGYHPKCKKIGLTHLSFADDLLIFCKGNSDSVAGVLSVLDHFKDSSGLKINSSKCEIFHAGISSLSIDDIKQITSFKIGRLPIRYLGIPLVTRKLNEKDYKKLLLIKSSKVSTIGLLGTSVMLADLS
ncbi:uncharacterized protein LOC120219279 [Hibiscus syriacus]|uniref:uncharacterized protein LOC120219279 n=1 Tax=Hibiscus syriacus TaxID=106335 RepID=UPI0019218E97|nr:uncharacterized protein LOC120219279 [Hibiscus syriacus]